jgi:hypothetical protein
MNRFDYHVHTDQNLIEVHPVGVVQISDILSYAREALSRGIVTEGVVEYYDLSEMTNLEADYESAVGLTASLQEWLSRGWLGSVFFTPQKYQFGMIRMMGAIVESIPGAPAVVMIPSLEPISLGEVRGLVAEHRRMS